MIDYDDIQFKPEWMRPPSWRWLVSEQYLANPFKNIDNIKDDKFLRELAEFKRYVKKNIKKPEKYRKKYPRMSEAYDIYLKNVDEGWRWLLEAYLMTRLTDKEIASRLKIPLQPGTVTRYRKSFFDIDSYRDSEAAVTANLLSTSKVKLTSTGVSDYTWKVFAYVWGADAFERMFFPHRGHRKEEHTKWLREEVSKKLDVYSFHTTRDMKQLYNEYAVNLLETARNYWDIDENQSNELQKQVKEDFINSLSKNLHMTVLNSNSKDEDYSEDFENDDPSVFKRIDKSD